MLLQRVITAVIGIPIIFGLIVLGGVAYSIAVGVILILAALEFFSATDPEVAYGAEDAVSATVVSRVRRIDRPLYRPRLPAVFGVAAIALLVAGADSGFDEWTGALVLALAATFLLLVLRGDPQSGLRDWLWVIGGVTYVGFLGSHLVPLRDLDDDGHWVMLALFSTFVTDTFAFLVGRAFGRVHIAPRISPGKTLEGSLAGLAGGFAAVLLLNWATGLDVSAEEIIPLAILLPLAAEVGDLAESLIKRGSGVKDTSELVPGHGGFLDRLDSILFTTPLVYYFVIWAIY